MGRSLSCQLQVLRHATRKDILNNSLVGDQKASLKLVEILISGGADIHGLLSGKKDPSTHLQKVLIGAKSKQIKALSEMEESEIQMAKYLIQHGAKVNLFDDKASPPLSSYVVWRNGQTFPPLHLAVMRNSPEMVEYLLQAGADINSSHFSGITALGMACLTEQGKICCFIIIYDICAKYYIISFRNHKENKHFYAPASS